MKSKLDIDLLYELASINIVEAELKKEKDLLKKKVDLLAPKPVNAVDYSKEKVQGGITHSNEEILQSIVQSNAEIFRLEQLLNIYKDTLDKKNKAICSVLTDREEYIYNETFIKGRSCDSVADELGFEIKTVIRDRKEIVKKINGIKQNIREIRSDFIEKV